MAPASSLPKSGGLGIEDDWTRITDPKEKKRAQNRVAQRKYRHRMKARLGELEARLGSGQKATTQSNLSNSKESDHVVEGRGTEHSAVEKTVPPDTIIYVDSLTRDGHQGESPNPSYVRDQSSLTHADRVEASSSSDGKPSQDNSCLPEAAIQDSTGFSYTPELGGGITKQFILDCLRFQNKLIDRLSIQTEPGCSDEDMYYQLMDEMPSGSEGVTQTDHVNTPGPVGLNAAGPIFKEPAQIWRSDADSQKAQQPQSSSDSTNFSLGNTHVKPAELMTQYTVSGPSMNETASSSMPSAHQKVHDIVLYAKTVGFDNFDDLVKAFYTHNLSDSSPLTGEQHLSRKRGLPKAIASLFQATEHWTSWERHGFHEEILKAAESLLRSEASATRDALQTRVTSLINQIIDGNQMATSESIKEVNSFMQHNLSNLWALSMGLTSGTGISWERGRQNSALAVILLLQLANELPREQLLPLLRMYLNGLEG